MPVMKKWTALFLLLLLTTGSSGMPAAAPAGAEPELSAEAAVLIEAETGTVLYAKNADKQLYPASLTKIMTLLLAMEEKDRGIVDWDTLITTSQRAWEVSDGGNTSTMFLNINQQATFKELIQGIAVISANDACVAVAEHLYGSEAAFVQRMNQRAVELGLENTNFTNTHGLHDPAQYTSALDTARLAAYFIITQPEAAAFQSEQSFTFNTITQLNRNPLLGVYPGADGVKTGYTRPAGWCLAASAKQNDMRLVSVVLNTPGNAHRREDSEVLLNYGFRNYELATIHEKDAVVASVSISSSKQKELDLVAVSPAIALVPRGDDSYSFEQRLILPDSLEAPIEAGEVIGNLQLINPAGESVSEIELAAAEDLERLGFFANIWRRVSDFFVNLWGSIFSGGDSE